MDSEDIDFPFPAERYLWVMETEQKARNLREQWIADGLTSAHFLITWAGRFSPFNPSVIRDNPIWLWPKDNDFHSLLGD
jgi:hypothetical protein